MCGLGGLARIDGQDLGVESDAILATMARTLAHRGPDAEELLRQGPVGMAFTRLSLVDPENGGQPLYSEDRSVVLIANGEVYNHRELAATLPAGTRFRTGSDCEVLVHLYRHKGLDFLDDVRGMFGLVLWDRRRGVLLLARDHFGVKPLFYTRDSRRIAFASEIKALFADPATPRRVDWDRALVNPTMTSAPSLDLAGPATYFEGVESVPAATILEIDLRDGATRRHTYWQLPDFDGDSTRTDQEIVGEFRELLADSVRACATADVSIGLFLSGGVDSAAVAALAAGTTELRTFSVLSGSTVVNGDARHARLVAGKLGVANHQIRFDAAQAPTADEWKRLLWLTEMPTCSPEQYYKHELHRHVRAEHPEIKGMLLGAAADEFCGGYSGTIAGDSGWEGFEYALTDMARRGRLEDGRPKLAAWWEGTEGGLLTDAALDHGRALRARDPYAAFVAAKMRDVEQFNCWHEDRTAAGSGTEARVPFLDRRLVELVASIPAARRERLLWDKAIIREAVADLLPAEVVHRPKVPFFYGEGVQHTHRPFIEMLTHDGSALVEEALATERGRTMLDADRVRALLRRLADAPLSAHVERLLPLLNLCLLDAMVTELPPPLVESAVLLPAVRPAHPVTDWDTAAPEIESLVFAPSRWTGQSVLAPADHVTLLTDTDGTAYLAVDGSLEYVLEGDGDWTALLHALDGTRTLAEACAERGSAPDSFRQLLDDSLDLGLLRLTEPAAAAPTE
ncbi:asparagine synthase (glutamine-hydrolyzing) [Streptomyces sp. Ru62]|uniref:asparagine synthase (glutamine-hydrolyzing) n=1 Tax=Streptomyces sp. Ru62 TaxID=2080745 RepID=UPI000CDE2802|nr:asparagine synthase (glutamine-hydrolyzing) [Streptomyces sp. Ru62]POX58224.1 asparagine synthase (glutamine-hydrolyzing) [Streptomyces sp. Ru62]